MGENGETLLKGGEFVGFATSRVAEYYALRTGVEKAIELGLKKVRFIGDNLMMINQMNGIYKIKNRDLLPIYADFIKQRLTVKNWLRQGQMEYLTRRRLCSSSGVIR